MARSACPCCGGNHLYSTPKFDQCLRCGYFQQYRDAETDRKENAERLNEQQEKN